MLHLASGVASQVPVFLACVSVSHLIRGLGILTHTEEYGNTNLVSGKFFGDTSHNDPDLVDRRHVDV